jgi:hypothetical protein
MASLHVRKLLKRLGLLEQVRAIKRRFVSPRAYEFKPADPRLLISTAVCMRWLFDKRLAEGSDYLEFGIFRGFNLWYTQALARAWGVRDMRFFGFDSFFGIPPVDGIDKDGPFHEGDFSAYREDVEAAITRFGVDWKHTFLVEGFFEQSLVSSTVQKHHLRRCSFAVVDCDLYSSTVPVLRFLEPLLGDEALLYFDDWDDYGGEPLRGEPKAFAEFTTQHAETFETEPFVDLVGLGGKGKAFVVRRKRALANLANGICSPCCLS